MWNKLSPYNADSDGWAYVFCVYSNGYLDGNNVDRANGVRPVINLKADTQFVQNGTGTSENPYVVLGTD